MPEYLAPGVYVEETSFRAKSIEGVSTSTTAFVGPTRRGPIGETPELITSLPDFERVYGALDSLAFADATGNNPSVNYVAHAARAYFDNGGARLYVMRTDNGGTAASGALVALFDLAYTAGTAAYAAGSTVTQGGVSATVRAVILDTGTWAGGDAAGRLVITAPTGGNFAAGAIAGGGAATAGGAPSANAGEGITAVARVRGQAGNGRLTFRLVGKPVSSARFLEEAGADTLLRVTVQERAAASDPWGAPVVSTYRKDLTGGTATWPRTAGTGPDPLAVSATMFDATPLRLAAGEALLLSVEFTDRDRYVQGWDELSLTRSHPRWIGAVLAEAPTNRADRLQNTIGFRFGADVSASDLAAAIGSLGAVPGDTEGRRFIDLAGGSDGSAPVAGSETAVGSYAHALSILSGLEDISIVAAPGSSAYPEAQAIGNALITHAERRRAYRIAVLDSLPNQLPGDVRTARGRIDSKYAALYYPWVIVANPLARPGHDNVPKEIALPPSGFVCGVYARNDVERGVHKAPANEVVRGALRFEIDINFAQQEMLNPIGVNCLRYLNGRGYRIWGARLASSDPEWKYVSDRRYFNYLEASIDRGTQWAVFEPNGERLWANVRQTITDFLYSEWKGGALLGTSPEEAFFVRCDRSTMTQNDLDNGRLVCLVGVAIIRPAEFVIFRIGQKTAEARS